MGSCSGHLKSYSGEPYQGPIIPHAAWETWPGHDTLQQLNDKHLGRDVVVQPDEDDIAKVTSLLAQWHDQANCEMQHISGNDCRAGSPFVVVWKTIREVFSVKKNRPRSTNSQSPGSSCTDGLRSQHLCTRTVPTVCTTGCSGS